MKPRKRRAWWIFAMEWLHLLLLVVLVAAHWQFSEGGIQQLFQHQCPPGCLCVPDAIDQTLLSISCRWPRIQEGLNNELRKKFPINATKSLAIQCSDSQQDQQQESGMAGITEGLFIDFHELVELKLMNCQCDRLSAEMFEGMPKLRSLHFSQTKRNLSQEDLVLEANLFKPLPQLETLAITGSRLKAIPGGVFCSLRFLQILNVSSNKLSDLRLGIGDDECLLENLVIYDASKNEIEHLSAVELTPFPALRELNLATNRLSSLDADTFKSTELIQSLSLKNNELQELPASLPDTIVHLNVANNRLSAFPASVTSLTALASLDVRSNLLEDEGLLPLQTAVLQHLDLSGNRLKTISVQGFKDSSESLWFLNLAGNKISSLEPNNLENFTKLQELDLSSNRISSLPYGSFAGLSELSRLRLSNNSIFHVDIEAFGDLANKLQVLDMARNSLDELPMAIGRLNRVRRMDFSGNHIAKVYKFVLNKLPNLVRINLSGNRLVEIDSYEFSDTAHLLELVLSQNRIERINSEAFDKCPRLKRLDLSGNRLNNLDGTFTSLAALRELDLRDNALEILRWRELPDELTELLLTGNQISSIENDGAADSHLRKLELSHNKLTTVEPDQLPPRINEVDLSHNGLTGLNRVVFADKPHIRRVDLRSNQLRVLPNGVFEQSLLNLNHIQLWLSGNPLECTCEMSWLADSRRAGPDTHTPLSTEESKHSIASGVEVMDAHESQCLLPAGQKNHRIARLNETVAKDFLCPYTLLCGPPCLCCRFDNCDCKSRCPDGCECYRSADNGTNVVRCNFQSSPSSSPNEGKALFFLIPMDATHIHLRGLNLSNSTSGGGTLHKNAFIGRTRLVELHINSSDIEDIEKQAFNSLPSLKVLHLANNRIKRINGDEANKTNRVHVLNLADNQLEAIDARLAEIMPNLHALHLDNNRLEELPHYLGDAPSRLKAVSMGNNPFRCDCSHSGRFAIQSWVQHNRNRLLDAEKLTCVENITRSLLLNDTTVLSTFAPNVDASQVSIPMLEFLQAENLTICVMKPAGIFGGTEGWNTMLVVSLLALLVAMIVLVACMLLSSLGGEKKRRRRDVSDRRAYRYPYTHAANGIDFHIGVDSPNASPTFYPVYHANFDVFLGYSRQDEKWVVENVCRQLEEQDYSVCLLHRDAPRYRNVIHCISDELNRLLEASQTLIIYLTANFLNEEWRTLQLLTSFKLFADRLTDPKRLVVIVGAEVDTNGLEGELGKILREKAYKLKAREVRDQLLSTLPRKDSTSETSQLYSDILYGSMNGVESAVGNIVPSDIV